jgi:hypothetical protein
MDAAPAVGDRGGSPFNLTPRPARIDSLAADRTPSLRTTFLANE